MSVEFVSGTHWSKCYVKGLEQYSKYIKAGEHLERKATDGYSGHGYSFNRCDHAIPEGVIFTIFDQVGGKGIEGYVYAICITTSPDEPISEYKSLQGYGVVKGNFREIVRASSVCKSKRLREWWESVPEQTLEYAEWCAKHIDIRGQKELPPMPQEAKV